ncbi:N-acetylgalactosaminyltransferase 6 [Drosophila pseudoobscura]|uniref:Polypeptide N-acetylgalactosaminyltransferase n=1 Tax=Drosophila pseudoobscura pseudoobscura TaxID=46245 RepID=Q29E48_DROPS|nr:N-acetylgalactosaminyltransferase 6 [Drosophila pseudoobscura]
MRRPNFKWMVKSILVLLISLTLLVLITSWISSSPYTNRPVHHGVEPQPEKAALLGQKAAAVNEDTVERIQPIHVEALKPRQQAELEAGAEKELDPESDYPDEKPKRMRPKNDEYGQQPEQEMHLKPHDQQNVVKDWHDYAAMDKDTLRVGIGEGGKAAKLEDEATLEQERRMSLENGFNALLSDSISVNRSLPDIRHKLCRQKDYLANLPTVSVIIIFYNEYLSVLMRSVHSLINRSPKELLKEIILVDDFSDRDYLHAELELYIKEHFSKIVRVVRLPNRTGLIGARSAGARNATAEVLLFLDSHVEANYNWLPPLLEPIAKNKRTAVCPFIDVIDHATFNYRAQDEGARGAFDWEFYYKRLPLLDEDLKYPADPFKSPVMAGGLFAISREFFWELGGYDEGLDIWGGEQYELSFKIWMCGGEMYDAPCSRIGHIYRGPRNHVPSPRKGDYLHRNYKRVAEVWMDEYKNYLYDHADGIYDRIDAGDLTEQMAIRKKLKCKSFKWFMEEVAFDLINSYPPVDPPTFALGAIQNVGDKRLCIDTMGRRKHKRMGVYACAEDLKVPQKTQFWELSWKRDLRLRRKKECLDVQIWTVNAPVWLWDCHLQGGNQYWSYDYHTQTIKHGRDGRRCLELLPFAQELVVNKCNTSNTFMKWNFGSFNKTALDNYDKDLVLNLD